MDDIKTAYQLGWRLGLKANALYRDGSKLSQPLTAQLIVDGGPEEDEDELEQQPPSARIRIIAELVADRALRKSGSWAARRSSIVAGPWGTVQTRTEPDGAPTDDAIEVGGAHDRRGALANDVAVAVAVGLQHGVPLEAFVRAFAAADPAQLHADHDRPSAASPSIDHVFRQLAIEYLGRDDIQHDVAV